ncbi:hypothetical protein [Streptomyces sp. AM 2-1-1]|uniref:hypothetical protein n=1 Tax=Streptomyces sp. AM 2-1-1 TaxID=3028709 RepID=UPI0023B96AA4|nr:hypothetical protein [Streptomyces sp. AM 2-1-1]WEH39719.1 hypothetical protein PZB77_09430 [Streptomyces sp. AM 2-1-1]
MAGANEQLSGLDAYHIKHGHQLLYPSPDQDGYTLTAWPHDLHFKRAAPPKKHIDGIFVRYAA